LARGPARLTVATGIILGENGSDAFAAPFALRLADESVGVIATGPRTGVSGLGGDAAAFPWRYWIEGDATVSPYKRHPRAVSAP